MENDHRSRVTIAAALSKADDVLYKKIKYEKFELVGKNMLKKGGD